MAKPNSNQLRHQARKLSLQALYAWQLSGNPIEAVKEDLLSDSPTLFEVEKPFDEAYFNEITSGVTDRADDLDSSIEQYLDRDLKQINPVEHAILRMATFELNTQHDVPYKVIINEAIELAKKFGAVDSHKYINGVLDKLCKKLRESEKQKKSA